MPARIAALTIASKGYLALARVTAASFLRQHPEIPFYLAFTDEVEGYFDPAAEPFRLLPFDELRIPDPRRYSFHYDQQEVSYAATPYAIRRLLDEGFDAVLFLKQETLVVDDLSPLLDELPRHPMVLTPHLLAPAARPNALRCELDVLRAGVFNGGVLGVANQPLARAFLEWWAQHTWRDSLREVERGLHFEQRWLDFAPSLVPGTHILRDPGVNVGHWNLIERRIQRQASGAFTAAGHPCRIVRFSGFEPEHPESITKYHRDSLVAETGDAAMIFADYLGQLNAAGYHECRQWPYAFGRYDDGAGIPLAARRAYWNLGDEAARFGDPFDTNGADCFRAWFATQQEVRR